MNLNELATPTMQDYSQAIARELGVKPVQVERTLALFEEGGTIPFIARYRKEATSGLDEVQLAGVQEIHQRLVTLHERKVVVLASIHEQGKLNEALARDIKRASTLSLLEDLYLPYKPRKRTRGQKAREAGLEPLVAALRKGDQGAVEELAKALVSEDFPNNEETLAGARDIVAEELSESAPLRETLRRQVMDESRFETKAKKDGDPEGKFESFVNISDSATNMPSHRLLGLFRAENAGAVAVKLATDDTYAAQAARKQAPRVGSEFVNVQFELAAEDAWKRLLKPSLESELRRELKELADTEAIEVFSLNLRKVLLNAPLGEHAVLGIDPGFRTGCKVALVDPQGDFVTETVIYPHPPQSDERKANETLLRLIGHFRQEFEVRFIAYGNGTASRETAAFLDRFIKSQSRDLGPLEAIQVNESGASIYSASEIAREEFPDLDLTVRGAISIARRLQDPLAELIKIDPKSIGVGQYQHDVDQKRLAAALDRVVESCVNSVGVDLNTASWALLRYVSGISERLAKAIVEYRTKIGRFESRKQLLKVAGLGPKAYELCAGFLRIRGGENVLDNTAVHPERYDLVGRICKQAGVPLQELVSDPKRLDHLRPSDFVDEASGAGLPTISDIFEELRRPGRDPRGRYESFAYDERVTTLEDLAPGMDLPGLVTNVTAFGCFVDIGVHQDGLVHISELANHFVKDPAQEVSVGDRVQVRVLEVDLKRSRIGLSRKALL